MAFLVNWFTIGVLLIILEMVLPGIFLMWFGVSALIVGIIALVIQMSMNVELILFACVSVLSVVSVLVIMRKKIPDTQSTVTPHLNQVRGTDLIGKTFTLESNTLNGVGSLNIGETTWSLSGPDAQAGTHITITNVENNSLIYTIAE